MSSTLRSDRREGWRSAASAIRFCRKARMLIAETPAARAASAPASRATSPPTSGDTGTWTTCPPTIAGQQQPCPAATSAGSSAGSLKPGAACRFPDSEVRTAGAVRLISSGSPTTRDASSRPPSEPALILPGRGPIALSRPSSRASGGGPEGHPEAATGSPDTPGLPAAPVSGTGRHSSPAAGFDMRRRQAGGCCPAGAKSRYWVRHHPYRSPAGPLLAGTGGSRIVHRTGDWHGCRQHRTAR